MLPFPIRIKNQIGGNVHIEAGGALPELAYVHEVVAEAELASVHAGTLVAEHYRSGRLPREREDVVAAGFVLGIIVGNGRGGGG